MKKIVLKLDFADEKIKQKAMMKVSGLSGLESLAFDPKEKKLVLTGDVDPVKVVAKLRKLCRTEIVTVGPAKEPEKKKEEQQQQQPPKKEEPKKQADDKKKQQADPSKEESAMKLLQAYPTFYQHPQYYYQQYHPAAAPPPPPYYARAVEEDPNGCVIS